jgi:D-3-phosphoglycerate dehydrogenase
MAIVLSTHPLHPDASARLIQHAELRIAPSLTAASLIASAMDTDVVIVRAPLPPALFATAPRLRAAIRHGAGLDMIPLTEATEAGVLVANLPGVNARSVAEYVIFAMLALSRRFRRVDHDLRTEGWLAGRVHADLTQELAGQMLGIIGPGNVGRAVHAIAQGGFGMRVIAASRAAGTAPHGFVQRAVDELVAEADIVVLCCPLTPETQGLMNRDRIGRMKSSACLINVSRGAVADEDALLAALREGRIAGAALDVFSAQPLPPDHPYFGLANVILTPHLAGITEQSMRRMGLGVAEETLRVLAGKPPLNLVNPEALPRWTNRFPGQV